MFRTGFRSERSRSVSHSFLLAALALAAAKFADAATTFVLLRTTAAREFNPVLRVLIERFGLVVALVGTSVAGIVVHLLLAEIGGRHTSRETLVRLAAVGGPALVYCAVAAWNAHYLL